MKTLGFVVLCFVGIVIAKNILRYNPEDALGHFEEFVITHNKEYKDEAEKKMRYEIFVQNLEDINNLNEKHELTEFGINQFSDLTSEEFRHKHSCLSLGDFGSECTDGSSFTNYSSGGIPDQFDWRSRGVVTDVFHQGDCGSCWAFSVTGNVESAYAIKTGQLEVISKQELVDCDTSSNGCVAGLPIGALEYLVDHGAMGESDYPYEAVKGSCRYDPSKVIIKVSRCLTLRVGEDELAQKLYEMGPLSIGIDSHNIQKYSGGIVVDDNCGGTQQNHAVLLVGYGIESGIPYWIIKNSWGPTWGENGYLRIRRGVNCVLIADTPAIKAVI